VNDQAVRAVTFDVGGTLIGPWPSVGHVYAQVAAEQGYPGLAPEVLNRRFAQAWRAFTRFEHKRDQWAALVDETFAGLLPEPPSRTFFEPLYERFSAPDAWRIYDDVRPTLERLAAQGLKLGIISNWDERLRPLLRALELERYFGVAVISCEAGQPKPGSGIFEAAVAALGLAPGAVLHVGDSLELDVRGATRSGLQALLLDRSAEKAAPGQIRSLRELVR
jgi:putative hydrolase of the HAD superfamily